MVTLAVIIASFGLVTGPAQATRGLPAMSCLERGAATYSTSPGLLYEPRLVQPTMEIRYVCEDTTSGVTRIGDASVSMPQAELSCVDLLGTFPNNFRIHWTPDVSGSFSNSVLTGTTTITETGTSVVITGRGVVSAGHLAGLSYDSALTFHNVHPTEQTECLGEPGLTQRQGVATLTIS